MHIPASADSFPEPSSPLALAHPIDWPSIRGERCGNCEILRSGVGDLVVGTLNVDTGVLTVSVPPDMLDAVREHRPQLEATQDGVRLDIVDGHSRRDAEALLRWRIDLERFGPQLRNASP
jgi:hypothetical protein